MASVLIKGALKTHSCNDVSNIMIASINCKRSGTNIILAINSSNSQKTQLLILLLLVDLRNARPLMVLCKLGPWRLAVGPQTVKSRTVGPRTIGPLTVGPMLVILMNEWGGYDRLRLENINPEGFSGFNVENLANWEHEIWKINFKLWSVSFAFKVFFLLICISYALRSGTVQIVPQTYTFKV